MCVEIKYPSKETIDRLTKELNLIGANEYTQDWEIEVANADQLQKYIEYYINQKLNLNEKATLMRIILEAYNEYFEINLQDGKFWEQIKVLLEKDYYIHRYTIKYWSCEEEDLENSFAITSLVRKLKLC